jgi:anti-sigma B factor antagonist
MSRGSLAAEGLIFQEHRQRPIVCAERLSTEERIVEYPVRKEGPYTVISLSGELDLSFSPEVRKHILACIENDAPVLVELADVEYIDSSGIASLVEGLQAAKRKQLEFGLVSVSKSAMQVLRIARLDSIFPIHDSIAAAIARRA